MDKYEYKVRVDEIKSLISEGKYADAVKVADSIDWRRVKSTMMLCTISDLYKINRRYEDSRDILLLAYERHAGGRLIVYSLCELSIKLGEYVQALEYYKEFVHLAPKDSGRYVLQYKLYEAQEVSLEERIEVLEELKKRDYREKWAYELAYLYHRVGLASKCVEECNEMALWFGEGRYVVKALELKMLHEPLSEEQQTKYEQMKQGGGFITSDFAADQKAIQEAAEKETEEEEDDEFSLEENILTDDTQEVPGKDELDIQVKTVDVSQYNTLNLQKELAESMKEILDDHKRPEAPNEPPAKADQGAESVRQETVSNQKTQIYEPVNGLDDHAGSEKKVQATKTAPRLRPQNFAGSNSNEEVFFGNTEEVNIQDVVFELEQKNESKTLFTPIGESELQKEEERKEPPASTDSALSNTGVIRTFHKPSGYDNMLTQEYDGQLSLVVPEQDKVEKQITGQLSIEDIMAEWEKMKQDNERKRMEDIRKRVQQQTDTLFADFDESTRSGLLEELEKAMVTAAMKEEKLKIAKERLGLLKTVDGAKNKKSQSLKKEEPQFPEEKEEETAAEAAKEEPAPEKEKEEPPKAESLWTRENLTLEELEEKLWQEAEAEMEGNAEGDYGEEEDGKASREEETADAEQQMSDELETGKQNAAEGSPETEEGEDKHAVREMTGSERELFAPFIHHKRTRRQIVETIDNISMASFTGNVIITGEEGTGTIALAKLLVKEVQLSDSNFSGKVAKISGSTMNRKDVASTLGKLSGGALIVEAASFMKKVAVEQLLKALNQEGKGLIVLLEDTKAAMEEFLATYPELLNTFNLRVDVEALDDQTLVRYARKYALEQEYAIDELGVLALHTRIADMQTSDHEVTLAEIEELVDEAIYYADKKTPKHFFDVLLGKRYDEEDMIVLRENDFMHY
ncbi:MAG: hypothetical protein HFI95_04570 [Lachnospiraceae bacterium]|nr:hypothetical protein [Lachnospiraceae bacterium]